MAGKQNKPFDARPNELEIAPFNVNKSAQYSQTQIQKNTLILREYSFGYIWGLYKLTYRFIANSGKLYIIANMDVRERKPTIEQTQFSISRYRTKYGWQTVKRTENRKSAMARLQRKNLYTLSFLT